MRFAILLLANLPICLTGCSLLVVNSGRKLDRLENREDVHRAFGEPVQANQADDVCTENYVTHRKIAEPEKNIYLCMGLTVTCGLGELFWFPEQSYVAIRRSVIGQHLKFFYNKDGNITKVERDGEKIGLSPRYGNDDTKTAEE